MQSKLKIAVVRFSSIGDIVLCSPVVRYLKTQKLAEIHFITKSRFSHLLDLNPNIDKVWTIDSSISEIMPELKKEEFNLVIDLHNNIRTKRLKSGLAKPSKTVDKLSFKKALLTRFGIDKLPDIHVVDRYLKTLESFGVEDDGKGLDFFFPTDFESKKYSDQSYVAAVIGGQHEGKKLPYGKWKELLAQLNYPVKLIGGTEDSGLGKKLAKNFDHVTNLAGDLNLFESADVVRQSKLVITNDTGMMHIASAFHKDIISLWGQTTPKFGMYPYRGGKKSLIVEPKGKRTLSKLGNKKTRVHVMEKIDVSEIVLHVDEVIGLT